MAVQPPTETTTKTKNRKTRSPFEKLGEWAKENILTVLLILAVVFIAVGGFTTVKKMTSDEAELRTMLTAQREEQMRSMAELTESFTEERRLREEAQRTFERRMVELDQHYAEELSRIQVTSTRRRRELETDPSQLPQAIEDTFGIPTRRVPQ